MNLRDFLIIYLACGAPFGVYYFLQNRKEFETEVLWLKSLLRFIFWIPFAAGLVARTSTFTNLYKSETNFASKAEVERELEIDEVKKFLENILSETGIGLSIYEFRETFDRYAGLSAENLRENVETAASETEIFRISNHPDKNLGEICLHRRNRKRLSFHQKIAGRDFVSMLGRFFDKARQPQILFTKAAKLAALLRDSDVQNALEKIYRNTLQTMENRTVRNTEKERWNSARQKPLTEHKISTNLQLLTATRNLSGKD